MLKKEVFAVLGSGSLPQRPKTHNKFVGGRDKCYFYAHHTVLQMCVGLYCLQLSFV